MLAGIHKYLFGEIYDFAGNGKKSRICKIFAIFLICDKMGWDFKSEILFK